MRYRFPRSKRIDDTDELRVLVHTSTLVAVPDMDKDLVQTLTLLRAWGGFIVWRTPYHGSEPLPAWLDSISSITFNPADPNHGSDFTVIMSFPEGEGMAWGYHRWDDERLEAVTGVRPGEPRYQTLKDGWLAIEASDAVDGSLYVTYDEDLLAYRDWIQDEIKCFIVTPREALDYIGVYLMREGISVRGSLRSRWHRHGYYFDRLCELIPAFHLAWATAICAEPEFPHGEDVRRHLESFHLRALRLLEVKDRIADQYYRPATNDTLYSMLGELNSFMPLVTGTFDSLAWMCRYVFEYKLQALVDPTLRRNTTIRLTDKQTTNGLISHVESQNKRLGQFLRSKGTQLLLGLFYPARDSIQHRHPLNGLTYQWSEVRGIGWPPSEDREKAYSLAILDQDADLAIQQLDYDDPSDYFSRWGIRATGQHVLLEPYKFVRQALQELSSLYDAFFDELDLANTLHISDESQREIGAAVDERAKGRPFSIPFLLRSTNPPIGRSFATLDLSRRPTEVPLQRAEDKRSMAVYGRHAYYLDLFRITASRES